MTSQMEVFLHYIRTISTLKKIAEEVYNHVGAKQT